MSTAEIIAELTRLSSAELAEVQAKLNELALPHRTAVEPKPLATHPAAGIWKDRTDLPEDSSEASKILRGRLQRREIVGTV